MNGEYSFSSIHEDLFICVHFFIHRTHLHQRQVISVFQVNFNPYTHCMQLGVERTMNVYNSLVLFFDTIKRKFMTDIRIHISIHSLTLLHFTQSKL